MGTVQSLATGEPDDLRQMAILANSSRAKRRMMEASLRVVARLGRGINGCGEKKTARIRTANGYRLTITGSLAVVEHLMADRRAGGASEYGISILPGLRASYDLEDFWVCRIEPEVPRKLSLAFRRGEKRSPVVQAFIEQVNARIVSHYHFPTINSGNQR